MYYLSIYFKILEKFEIIDNIAFTHILKTFSFILLIAKIQLILTTKILKQISML